jgi:hypothetical protein
VGDHTIKRIRFGFFLGRYKKNPRENVDLKKEKMHDRILSYVLENSRLSVYKTGLSRTWMCLYLPACLLEDF